MSKYLSLLDELFPDSRASESISPAVDTMDLFINCEGDLKPYLDECWRLKRIDCYTKYCKAVAHLERPSFYKFCNFIDG